MYIPLAFSIAIKKSSKFVGVVSTFLRLKDHRYSTHSSHCDFVQRFSSSRSLLAVCRPENALVSEEVQNMKPNAFLKGVATAWMTLLGWCHVGAAQNLKGHPDQVLEWNQQNHALSARRNFQ